MAQIDNLGHCKALKRLSLLNNIVTKAPNYRLYTIFKIPSITVLDFQKVRDKERDQAEEMFGFDKDMEETLEKGRTLRKQVGKEAGGLALLFEDTRGKFELY